MLSRQMTFVIEKKSAYQLSILLFLQSTCQSSILEYVLLSSLVFLPTSLFLAVHYSSVVYIHSIHQSCFSSNVNNMNQTRTREKPPSHPSPIKWLLMSMWRKFRPMIAFHFYLAHLSIDRF